MFETTFHIIQIFALYILIGAAMFSLAFIYVVKTENRDAKHRRTHPRNQIKEPFDVIEHFNPSTR